MIFWIWLSFVMCTLIFRDCVLFCNYIKRHVYPGNQGTHDKLNQIQLFFPCYSKSHFRKLFDSLIPLSNWKFCHISYLLDNLDMYSIFLDMWGCGYCEFPKKILLINLQKKSLQPNVYLHAFLILSLSICVYVCVYMFHVFVYCLCVNVCVCKFNSHTLSKIFNKT